MKLHISEEEFMDLQDILHDWQRARDAQATCVTEMVETFACNADEAVDLLNSHRTATAIRDAEGIEVHKAKLGQWLDGEAALVWLLICGGAVWVSAFTG